jgi:CRISPR-associated Csx2 family protein
MARKVFISFLGAVTYKPTKYYCENDRSDLSQEIFFVQDHLIRQNPEITEAIIFTTKEASKWNYHNRMKRRTEEGIEFVEGKGLKSVLQALKCEGVLKDFREELIPNGYTEEEIWEVFQKVFEKLKEGDRVVFDVTFGFRSLPILVIVLLNYARTLRNIEVEAIYYGNYEAGRAEKESQNIAHVEAPVLRLDTFVELQEWTHAAQSFMVGNVAPLSAITQDKHPEFSKEIDAFSKAILTCRGLGLVEDVEIDKLKDSIRGMSEQSDIEVVLQPLLEKVSAKIASFGSKQLSNGFAAVEWCIQHNMTQQGITFLQETVISYMVERFFGDQVLTSVYVRDLAGSALQLYPTKKNRFLQDDCKPFQKKTEQEQEEIKTIYHKMRDFVKSKTPLNTLYGELVGKEGFRNDINHCGYRRPYLRPKELNESLKSLFEKIKSLNL